MALWANDDELFYLIQQELFPALLGDILDKIGLKNQFLPPQIKPLDTEMLVVGRAMTVLEEDLPVNEPLSTKNLPFSKPFGLMFEALDSLKKNEVYVCSGASPEYALWGGLMSTRARCLGATGTVVNGYSRDTPEILNLNFPTFSMGGYSQDQEPRGRVVDFNCEIKFGNVKVRPNDLIYGDRDGVVVVPKAAELDVINGAIDKVRGEQWVRRSLVDGMSAVEAYARYGIM